MLKKILLLAALLASFISYGQVTKGSILIEGSGSINFSKTENEQVSTGFSGEGSNFSLVLSPRVGLFTSESFLIGAGLSYNFSSSEAESSSSLFPDAHLENKSHDLLLTTYFRKYYKLNDKLYFTGTLYVQGGIGKSKATRTEDGLPDEETKSDQYRFDASISPGLVYFLSNKWALTTSVGQLYTSFRWINPEDDDQTKTYSANAGLSFQLNTFSVGVQYFLKNGADQ